VVRTPKMTTLAYFKLVERLENEKIYTLHEIVEEGRVQGFFAKSKNLEKAMARAVEALRVRARRNNLKVDRFVNDAKYIHRGYYGWRLKLIYKPAFYSEAAYESLIQLAVDHDGDQPGHDAEIDHQDLAASTRIVAEIKKRAFAETKVLALAEARAEARAELRRAHRLRLSLAFLALSFVIIAGIGIHLRGRPSWSAKARPVALFNTDFADINAVFELDEPLLVVGYRGYGLGDWLAIKGREGFLVQIKRDEVMLETSYGLEAFPLPPLYVLGTLDRAELEELEAILRESPEGRRLFAELCADEMLLWQHMNLEARPRSRSEASPVAATAKGRWSPRALGRVAALLVAFLSGCLVSAAWTAREAFLADVEPGRASSVPALQIVYPPPVAQQGAAVVYPLGYDESGRPTLQPNRTSHPLEIANL